MAAMTEVRTLLTELRRRGATVRPGRRFVRGQLSARYRDPGPRGPSPGGEERHRHAST